MCERAIQERMHAVRLARLQPPAAAVDISEPLQQISCWLVPPDCSSMPPNAAFSSRASLLELSSRLARQYKLPGSMAPHMTLIGNVGLSEEEAASRLETLKGSGPVACAFERLAAAERGADGKVPWYQSCVALVKPTPQLLALQRKCRAALLDETPPLNTWAPPLAAPHVSLAYAANNELERMKLSESPVPPPFVASALALYTTTGPQGGDPYQSFVRGEWREVGRVAL